MGALLVVGSLAPLPLAATTSHVTVIAVSAPYQGSPAPASPAVVGVAGGPGGHGYYVLRSDGTVGAYGAVAYGSIAARSLPVGVTATGIALDPSTGGYWIATSTGGVFGFDAPLYGSPLTLAHGHYDGVATAGIAATSAGYLVALANGQVDAFSARAITVNDNASKLAFGATVSGVASAIATRGYYLALDLAPRQGYYNPLRALTSLVPQEIDQGVDYCGSGPIYALGNGVVTNLYDPSWPSGVFIAYRLSDGPAAGHVVYVAENVTPTVAIGERVNPGTVVGILRDAKTCLETGWARDGGRAGYAAGFAQFNGKNSTAYGLNFSALLELLGARPGLVQPYGPPGTLPAGWPTWGA